MNLRGIPDRCQCETCEGRVRCAFLNLPQDLRIELDRISRPCFFAQGTVLFLQGEPAEGVLLVRNGWVKLFHTFPDGDVASTAIVGSGYLLGLPEVLSGNPRPLGGEAVSGCHFDFLPAGPFLRFTGRHFDVAQRLLKAVCGELSQLAMALAQAAGRQPSVGRLLAALQKLAVDCGRSREGGVRIGLSLTVRDLADKIGCSRQWTSKLLSDLEGEGKIERRSGWITLTAKGLEPSPVQ